MAAFTPATPCLPLMAEFTRLLVEGDGSSVGEAIAAAKRDYFWETSALNHFHAKTMAGTVLYGLPMVTGGVDGEAAAGEDQPATAEPELSFGPAVPIGTSAVVQRLSAVVAPDHLERVDEETGSYYALRGRRPRAG